MSYPQDASREIEAAVTTTMHAAILMQTYLAAELNQPVLTLKSAPNLAAHQGAANQAISDWLQSQEPRMEQSVDDVAGYGESVKTMMPVLLQLAEEFAGGDGSKQAPLIQGISQLQQQASSQLQAAHEWNSALAPVHRSFDRLATDFSADLKDSQTAGGSEVAELNSQLAQLNQDLDADFATIAAGATNALPGVFEIAVGAAVLVASEGSNFKVLKAGIETTSNELGEVSKASDDAKEKIQKYGSLLAEVSELQAELAAVATIQSAAAGYAAQVASIYSASGRLSEGWSAVESALAGLAASASGILPDGFQADLQGFGNTWDDITAFIEKTEGFFSLTVVDQSSSNSAAVASS